MTTLQRPLHPDERVLLERYRQRLAQPVRLPVKVYWLFALLIAGEVFLHLMSRQQQQGFFGLFALLSASAFAIVGYVPIAFFITKHRRKQKVLAIDKALTTTITVTAVTALRTALAMEHAREGDLWIIEFEPGHLLYLWDYKRKLRRILPRERFELYDETTKNLTGRIAWSDSPRSLPTFIDSHAKYRYFSCHGAPEQLSTMKATFEDTIDLIGAAL